jgi:hypothetical protein
MLHKTLKQLMEYIGGDREEYVGKREGCPKWADHWLETSFVTGLVKSAYTVVG